jgi:hypothetical protein
MTPEYTLPSVVPSLLDAKLRREDDRLPWYS